MINCRMIAIILRGRGVGYDYSWRKILKDKLGVHSYTLSVTLTRVTTLHKPGIACLETFKERCDGVYFNCVGLSPTNRSQMTLSVSVRQMRQPRK